MRSLTAQQRLRLMADGLVNYSGFLISGLIGLALVPLMVRYLGTESYGLWLAALAISGMVSGFDFGLFWSVTREVSAEHSSQPPGQTASFVSAAGNLYLLLGIAGALLIAAFSVPLGRGLHLSADNWGIARLVFALVGAGLVAERMVMFSNAVLSGLRRFDVMNAITVGTVLLRASGFAALLLTGRSVLALAFWSAMVSALSATVALKLVRFLQPRFAIRLGGLHWRLLQPHISFGLLSFLSAIAGRILWDSAPLVIGFLHGSAAIVPYSIGQRFPLAVSELCYRVAEVFFPAATEQERAGGSAGTSQILELATRWVIVLAVPFCIVPWIVAPNLLQAWLGTVPAESVLVLRLTSAAVLADALGVAAIHVLLGRGNARAVCLAITGIALPGVALSLVLVRAHGSVGAAWALCVAVICGGCAFLSLGARACKIPVRKVLWNALQGLMVPTLGCTAATYGLVRVGDPRHWGAVLSVCAGGGLTYAVGLYFQRARQDEKRFIRYALESAWALIEAAIFSRCKRTGRIGPCAGRTGSRLMQETKPWTARNAKVPGTTTNSPTSLVPGISPPPPGGPPIKAPSVAWKR